ncbi:hypothetical protein LSAT2_021753 [Lamellibrachia satsuma]|nr:hypothetical protein LSAT2_021753 [Lamellibrachia satsuma]
MQTAVVQKPKKFNKDVCCHRQLGTCFVTDRDVCCHRPGCVLSPTGICVLWVNFRHLIEGVMTLLREWAVYSYTDVTAVMSVLAVYNCTAMTSTLWVP